MIRHECPCGRPIIGTALCDKCSKTLAYAIANIAAYHHDLTTVATNTTRYTTTGPTVRAIGKTQPLPLDLRFINADHGHRPTTAPATQLRWDTWSTIVAWISTVMAERPELTEPACAGTCPHPSCQAIRLRRWPRPATVHTMCLYLHRMHTWIETQPWAPQMLDELTNLEHRLRRLIDRPIDHWYAGPCTAGQDHLAFAALCGHELYVPAGATTVTCPDCGWTYTTASRRAWLLAAAENEWATATRIAWALEALDDEHEHHPHSLVRRIDSWRRRRRLRVRDYVEVDGVMRPRYRVGDVQHLLDVEASDAAEKPGARRRRPGSAVLS